MLSKILRSLVILFTIVTFAPVKYTSSELKPYYLEFLEKIEKKCKNGEAFLPPQRVIIISNLGVQNVGVCYRTNVSFWIIIDRYYWDSFNDDDKLQVIYHELSHCVLQADHIDVELHYMHSYMQRVLKEQIEFQTDELIDRVCK